MATYNINFTDINKSPIQIEQGDINTTAVDIALFGRINLEYGEKLNENLLHLLENFSCPEDPNNQGNPDLSVALVDTLSHPTEGQLWNNTTQKVPFVWNGTSWEALGSSADYAANWGKVFHGTQLPLPVSSTGHEFCYDDCVWVVSPSGIDLSGLGFSYMVCTTNDSGVVNHQYAKNGTNALIPAIANYMIIGMRSSNNLNCDQNPHNHNYNDNPPPPPPVVNVTPSPTPTPAQGATMTPTPSPTATATVTPSQTPVASSTPTPSPTPSITPSISAVAPISAMIYIDPSIGMATDFGAAESRLTNCPRGNDFNGCEKALGVWVANIMGGNGGPYTISWNLKYFYVAYYLDLLGGGRAGPIHIGSEPATDPPVSGSGLFPWTGSTFSGNRSGYSATIAGQTLNVVGGLGLRANAYCRANYYSGLESGSKTVGYSVALTILAGSTVTISDGTRSTTYYIPGGSTGQVTGTQLKSPPSGNYTDTYDIIINSGYYNSYR